MKKINNITIKKFPGLKKISKEVQQKNSDSIIILKKKAVMEVINSSLRMIILYHLTGEVYFQNPMVQNLLGYSPLDLYGKNIYKYIHENDHIKYNNSLNSNGTNENQVVRFINSQDDWINLNVCTNVFTVDNRKGKLFIANIESKDSDSNEEIINQIRTL